MMKLEGLPLQSPITEAFSMSESLALISHSLADIGIVLHDIERDQQEILDLLRQREDLESRLAYLEHVVHGALMSDEVDDSTRSHGEEPG